MKNVDHIEIHDELARGLEKLHQKLKADCKAEQSRAKQIRRKFKKSWKQFIHKLELKVDQDLLAQAMYLLARKKRTERT